jgi:hypothetical protein
MVVRIESKRSNLPSMSVFWAFTTWDERLTWEEVGAKPFELAPGRKIDAGAKLSDLGLMVSLSYG